MNEDKVWELFSDNWVFKLYSIKRFHWTVIVFVLSASPIIIGAIGSLFANAFLTYVANVTPYLYMIGFAVSLVSFKWFTSKISRVLTALCPAFMLEEQEYIRVVRKWADSIANRNWTMILVGLIIAALNLNETIAIWVAPQPPMTLEPWTNSHARLFFAAFYGFVHVVITPFLLGSGAVGLLGTMLLIGDLLKRPLRLAYYRRLETVVGFAAWLVMWALIALASVSFFARPFVAFRVDILALDISGSFQSILASVLAICLGSIPIMQVRNAVLEAKERELARWEHLRDHLYAELSTHAEYEVLGKADVVDQLTLSDAEFLDEQKLKGRYGTLEMVDKLIKQIEGIPNVPISWPSIAQMLLGALVSIGSSIVSEWLT